MTFAARGMRTVVVYSFHLLFSGYTYVGVTLQVQNICVPLIHNSLQMKHWYRTFFFSCPHFLVREAQIVSKNNVLLPLPGLRSSAFVLSHRVRRILFSSLLLRGHKSLTQLSHTAASIRGR